MEGKWLSPKPERCDLCGRKLRHTFYDAKIPHGSWGILCVRCFVENGCSLGLGRGQLYNRNTLLKMAG